jgi:hypothetical protein
MKPIATIHANLSTFALEVVSEAILILETNCNGSKVILANSAFERLSGIERHSLTFGHCQFLLDEDRFLKTVEEALARKEVISPRCAFQLKKTKSQSRVLRLSSAKNKAFINAFVTFHPYEEHDHMTSRYCCCVSFK